MLSRTHRLCSERDIAEIARRGYRVQAGTLTWKAMRRTGGDRRFAIVISTKVSKKATERNRIRRWIRELIRERMDKFPAGADYLIMVQPRTPLPCRADLLRDTNKALTTLSATKK